MFRFAQQLPLSKLNPDTRPTAASPLTCPHQPQREHRVLRDLRVRVVAEPPQRVHDGHVGAADVEHRQRQRHRSADGRFPVLHSGRMDVCMVNKVVRCMDAWSTWVHGPLRWYIKYGEVMSSRQYPTCSMCSRERDAISAPSGSAMATRASPMTAGPWWLLCRVGWVGVDVWSEAGLTDADARFTAVQGSGNSVASPEIPCRIMSERPLIAHPSPSMPSPRRSPCAPRTLPAAAAPEEQEGGEKTRRGVSMSMICEWVRPLIPLLSPTATDPYLEHIAGARVGKRLERDLAEL